MKELQDLLHELRCDINYCKVSYENDTEIDNANDTLLKVEKIVKNLTIPDVSVSVADVRQAFADYYKSEGCDCCQDTEAHDKEEEKLAELLQPDQYDDESGFNWYKYATEY